MESCLIQAEENDTLIQEVKRICEKHGISAYNEERNQGTLRHVMARYGQVTGDYACLHYSYSRTAKQKAIIEEIATKFPEVKSIVQNVNPKRTNVIFGDKTTVLYGSEYIYDFIGDIKFAISARSFYQVNPEQTKVLYDKTLEYAKLDGNETVIDAYCGIDQSLYS